jgi:hypothetical protein
VLSIAAAPFIVAVVGCGGGDANSTPAPELNYSRAEQARTCLENLGARVIGGQRSRGDHNAPDVELIVRDKGAVAFLAFYKSLERARRYESSLRRNSRRFGGSVVRRGHVSVVWVKNPDGQGAREIVRCVWG